MPRLTQLSNDQASPEAATLFNAIKAKIGMVPNLYRVAGNQPAALKALLGVNDALATGSFDARTREAIALAVAGANSCDYCASAHSAISKGLKIDETEIDAHLSGRAANPRLAAILRLSVDIVETRGMVSDVSLANARAAGLEDGDIVEAIANVIANIFTNYLNHIAETEIDFPVRQARAA